MKRRHLLVLPALAFMPMPTLRSECQEGFTGSISEFCRQCYNDECEESRTTLTGHLLKLRNLVEARGLVVWYMHVSGTAFRELTRENGVEVFGRVYQPWKDHEVLLYAHNADEGDYEDRVSIHAYAPGCSPRSKNLSGEKFEMNWSDFSGSRIDITREGPHITVGEPVEV